MGAKIILPARAKGNMACGHGTKIFLDGVEVKDVTSFSIPTVNVDSIIEVCITVPLEDIVYADE